MRWKSLCLLILKSITETIKKFNSLYDFEGRCLKIRDICMDFEPYFKVHNLVSVHPKNIILGQKTNLNMIFHVMVSVYRLVKIWNSPQFPDEFRNGQCSACVTCMLKEFAQPEKLIINCSSSLFRVYYHPFGDFVLVQSYLWFLIDTSCFSPVVYSLYHFFSFMYFLLVIVDP